MKVIYFSLLVVISMFFAGCKSAENGVSVYYNGKVYTADNAQPDATAFVVKDGKFIYVGDDRGAMKYEKGTDLHGKRIVPGMIDAHCHPVFGSLMSALDVIAVDDDWGKEEVLAFLKEKAVDAKHKDLPYIIGMGFDIKCRPVNYKELDKAIPDRPAIIFAGDLHAYWLNSKAMEMAKLTRDTPDPAPGASFYERDAEGNLTGYIVEIPAGADMLKRMGIFTSEQVRKGLAEVQKIFARNGITAVFDAGFLAINEETGLEALQQAEKNDELAMRFFTSYVYLGKSLNNEVNMLKTMREHQRKYTSDLLAADTLKMFVDGTLEVQSAWLSADYLPPAKGRGVPALTLNEMLPAARHATAAGFNVHNHAIGDAAISTALDLHKELGTIQGTKTICHIQVPPPDGVQRFIEQHDTICQATPCWLTAGKYTEQVLGRERYLRQVPLASLIKGGVTVTLGSDFPISGGEVSVERFSSFPLAGGEAAVNPFNNMQMAVNRATDDQIAPPKTEAITVKDCIDAYTINGAKQLTAADRIGSITVGKSADFVILSEDFFTIKPERLIEVVVNATYFRGKCVYNID